MTNISINTASDFTDALQKLSEFNQNYHASAQEHQSHLTKPARSLGKLEEIATWLAGWHNNKNPTIDHAVCIVFAANHGVAAQGVSAFPAEVTAQMVENFENGGAAINQLTNLAGAKLKVVAMDLNNPTNDFTKSPAMTEKECCQAIQIGANAVPENADILLLGEMGIANTTSAAAVTLSTFGGSVKDWVGYGTGISDQSYILKQKVVTKAFELHQKKQKTSFDILRTVGGRELAAIAGAVLEARYRRIPVLLDGFISTAAAAVLLKDNRMALDHALVSHISVELGHQRLIKMIEKQPLLDLEMRLGEASGAAVALLIVRAALATHNGMATFDQAGISNNE